MVTDEHLASYNGFDLVDPKLLDDTGLPREKIEKGMTIPQLYDYVKHKLFSSDDDVSPSVLRSVIPKYIIPLLDPCS